MRVFQLVFALALVSLAAFGQTVRARHYSNSLAPYVVSPQAVVDRMLELAELKPNETLYDLGSGDGRILITAAQRYHAKAIGVEISEFLVNSTNASIGRLGLQNLARVIHGDLLQVDLSPADVVTIYLMTESNNILRPNLEKYLRPGARVVSHDYAVPGWKPKFEEKTDRYAGDHKIYLYVMPRK
jgi:cyclopropane fatty-acyl-phospholipid synthase-like methyltransferase